jgi:hypothetical protein
MSSTQKTPHYNLSQFGDSPNDKPSWRGDYTADMSKIDSQMYRNETDATTAASTANTAKSTADNALSLAQTNKSDIAEQESYFTALGVTSEPTAQALMSTINGKAENTALTVLQGTVGLLSDTVAGKADATQVYTKAQSDTTFTKQGGYSGTAQQIHSEATNASAAAKNAAAAATNVQEELTNLKTSGQSPMALVQQTNALTNHFSNVSWTVHYSPLSKLVNIMVRFGSPDGHSNANCTSNVSPGSLIIGTMPEGYRPNGFINSYPFTYGNESGTCNISITVDGVVSFYCQGKINTNTQLKQTLQFSYFVV